MTHHRSTPKVGERITRGVSLTGATTDPAARRIRFIASDESVDRYGDIIRASGWELDNFRKNPQLLYGHGRAPGLATIGRVASIDVMQTKLIADCEFMPEGMNDFADTIWRAVDAGFLRASSVGFMPTVEPNIIRGEADESGYRPITGFEFVGQELLELSVVPVPANPAALALARDLGLAPGSQRLLLDYGERDLARAVAEHRRRTLALASLGTR
jgi:hypothetical protein